MIFIVHLGGVWIVKVKDIKRNKEMVIGEIMFEGDGSGMSRLATFDEMIGCNKCNAIYHKDTRYGLTVSSNDGTERQVEKMVGRTKAHASGCKKYMITGTKAERSITFESGHLTTEIFENKKNVVIWQ